MSLAWESTADLDIYVKNVDTGELLYWGLLTSEDGNTKLDVDNRGGDHSLHVENVSFNGDFPGSYAVYVNNHASDNDVDSIPYTVVVKMGTQTQTFEDTWNINELGEHQQGDVGQMMGITTVNI